MHQEKQEGLGHAISQAGTYVDDEPILIVLDDGIFEFDPERVINSPDSLIGVRTVDNPSAFGISEIDETAPHLAFLSVVWLRNQNIHLPTWPLLACII